MWLAIFTSYSCFGISIASDKCFDSISKNRSKLFFIISFVKINYGFWCSGNYSYWNYYRCGRMHSRISRFSKRFPNSRGTVKPSSTGNGRTPDEYGQLKARDRRTVHEWPILTLRTITWSQCDKKLWILAKIAIYSGFRSCNRPLNGPFQGTE